MDADWIYANKDGTRELVTEIISSIPSVGDGKVGPGNRSYTVVGAVWGVIGITIWAKEV